MIGFGLVIVLSGLGFVVGSRIVKPITALQREAEGLRLTLATPERPDAPHRPSRPYRTSTERAMRSRTWPQLSPPCESSWKKTSARSDLNSMN